MKALRDYLELGNIEDLERALIGSFLNGEPLSSELLDATISALHGDRPHKKNKRTDYRKRLMFLAVRNLKAENPDRGLKDIFMEVGERFHKHESTVKNAYYELEARTKIQPQG